MKQILVDIYKAKDEYSGLGQFSINFAQELSKQKPPNYLLNFLAPKNFQLDGIENAKVLEANLVNRYFPSLTPKFDLWHGLSQIPSFMPNKKTKFILTVHDLNFLIEKDKSKALKYLKKLQKKINRADGIVTISNYTKKVLEENISITNKPIKTIYNGVRLDTFEDATKPAYIKKDKFFFVLGVFKEKKNFEVLIPMMRYFPDYELIIGGNYNTEYGKKISQLINDLGFENQVNLVGGVKAKEKYWLYNNCEALLFPSLAEGFGLPVIEAMRVGKPVFLSKHTCLPEIGGELAYYFESFNPELMANYIKTKLSEYNLNKGSISNRIIDYSNKFTWTKCIEQYLEFYDEILSY